jgi:hypothetical protein
LHPPLPQQESALNWVLHKGHQLTRLSLGLRQQLQQLPCPNLLELWLDGDVQLGPADGYPGVIQGCTKLTRLEMQLWDNIDAPNGVVLHGSLSSLVHLQHLAVRHFSGSCSLSVDTLPRLQHLTYLDVHGISIGNLSQLAGLTRLQELRLVADSSIAVGPSSVPGLELPASLTKLKLLSPVEAGILSVVPTGLRYLQLSCDVEGTADSEGLGAFLSYMANLQHLTQLDFSINELQLPPAGPAYSTLTATSNLVHLRLELTQLPPGIWPFLFPITHKLPHLTCLDLDVGYAGDYVGLCWGAADLASLVSCCPGLCVISSLALQPGLHVSELQKLTALTTIEVVYFSDALALALADFQESMRGLAAVTQLRSLQIDNDVPDMGVASLLPLTSLTALTRLDCYWGTREGEYRDWKMESASVATQVNTLAL